MKVDLEKLTHLFEEHVKEIARAYATIVPKAGFDAVVIHSGSLKSRTDFDDQFWPLRPTPHFQHWVPLAQPDCAIIYTIGKKPQLVWLQANSIWEKPAKPETEHFLGAFEISRPTSLEKIKDLLPKSGKVAFKSCEPTRRAFHECNAVS